MQTKPYNPKLIQFEMIMQVLVDSRADEERAWQTSPYIIKFHLFATSRAHVHPCRLNALLSLRSFQGKTSSHDQMLYELLCSNSNPSRLMRTSDALEISFTSLLSSKLCRTLFA
jgi:hypothetical protein